MSEAPLCQIMRETLRVSAFWGVLYLYMFAAASAIEAQRATTVQQGVVHESAVAATGGETPNPSSTNPGADNGLNAARS